MKSSFRYVFAVLAGLALFVPAVLAKVAPPPPVPERVARAAAVVVGKVTSVENKSVQIDGNEYSIAIVQVEDCLYGAKGLTHVRVAYIAGENRRFPHLNLKVGQEACFFLNQQPKESFFVTRNYYDVLPKESGQFKQDVELARKCGKLLQDPDASLQAKDVESRALTAALLLTRYRTPTSVKQEAIDAAQSKLILLALADADWSVEDYRAPINPQRLFTLLPEKEKFGWKQPADFKELPGAAKAWLKDNAEKYRIQRFVD